MKLVALGKGGEGRRKDGRDWPQKIRAGARFECTVLAKGERYRTPESGCSF